jgi:hypothetical protein
MNTLTSPTLVKCNHEAIDELVARVLRRAHRGIEHLGSPDEARAILHVAHSFADELADLDPRFDRLQFMKDVTEDRSHVRG